MCGCANHYDSSAICTCSCPGHGKNPRRPAQRTASNSDARKRNAERTAERVEGDGLEAVIAAHLFTLYPGEIACDCEWTHKDSGEWRTADDRMIAAHCTHLAAAVRAHYGEQAAEGGDRDV